MPSRARGALSVDPVVVCLHRRLEVVYTRGAFWLLENELISLTQKCRITQQLSFLHRGYRIAQMLANITLMILYANVRKQESGYIELRCRFHALGRFSLVKPAPLAPEVPSLRYAQVWTLFTDGPTTRQATRYATRFAIRPYLVWGG